LYDQLSRAVNSARAAHLGKIDKLFNGPLDSVQLFFSCGYIFFRDEVICSLELRGSLTRPQYPQLACSFFSCPTGCHTHQRLMFNHIPGIILANAFFDQPAVVVVKRKVLSHCLIDNKASVPLLYLGNRV
jgi:hypothetical protein